jgi:type 1 fimbriae regulatory protein FimB
MSALQTNALLQFKPPKAKTAVLPRAKMAYLTAEQLEQVLRTAKDKGARDYAMFLCAFSHGMRASEICNLRMDDINLSQGTVRINRLKGSLDTTQTFLKMKGKPLLDEERALRAWLSVREDDRGGYVFNSRKSVRLSRVQVYRLFRNICVAAGITDKTLHHPHVLKHSLAMAHIAANTNAFVIRQLLGHKSFDSTLQYTSVSDQQASEANATMLTKVF